MALPMASWRGILRDLEDLRSSAVLFLYGGSFYTSFYTVWFSLALRKGAPN